MAKKLRKRLLISLHMFVTSVLDNKTRTNIKHIMSSQYQDEMSINSFKLI